MERLCKVREACAGTQGRFFQSRNHFEHHDTNGWLFSIYSQSNLDCQSNNLHIIYVNTISWPIAAHQLPSAQNLSEDDPSMLQNSTLSWHSMIIGGQPTSCLTPKSFLRVWHFVKDPSPRLSPAQELISFFRLLHSASDDYLLNVRKLAQQHIATHSDGGIFLILLS